MLSKTAGMTRVDSRRTGSRCAAVQATAHTLRPRVLWRGHILSPRGPRRPTVRLIACAMAEYLGAGSAFPSTRLLESRTGLARNTVMKGLKALVQLGWLRQIDTGRRGKYGSRICEYQLWFPNGVLVAPMSCNGNGAPVEPMPNEQWLSEIVHPAQLGARNGAMGEPETARREERAVTNVADTVRQEDRNSNRKEEIVNHHVANRYSRQDAERMADIQIALERESRVSAPARTRDAISRLASRG